MNFSLILREPLLDQNQTLCDSLKKQVNMFGSSPPHDYRKEKACQILLLQMTVPALF